MCPKTWGFFSVRSLLIQLILLIVGYFIAKYLNENGFPTLDEVKALFVRPPKTKKGEDDDYDYNIGYASDSDEEGVKNEPKLELDDDEDAENYQEYLGLKNRKDD